MLANAQMVDSSTVFPKVVALAVRPELRSRLLILRLTWPLHQAAEKQIVLLNLTVVLVSAPFIEIWSSKVIMKDPVHAPSRV
jgi:hypothetical protein